MMRAIFLLCAILVSGWVVAQNGTIKGRVYEAANNEPIPFATVVIQNTSTGSTTDIDGNFEIKELKPELYNIEVSYVGFKSKVIYEVQVTNNKPVELDIALEENTTELKEVTVKASPFSKTQESPVSLRNIGVSEIERNPGGNRDISKVIQSLPGVATTVSFRNDIIIRGGAPNENRFYLDGIEVPNINHFATQGASGGPVGMINVNFIREVDFYSGAFPADRGNALSSVFEFKQKDPRTDRIGGNITIGATDFGLTVEGPITKKNTFMFSARRSYLQFLFKALELPFLPIYNDFQLKNKIEFNDKNQLTIIGLAAIDDFELNLDANETEEQRYILNTLPENTQWNYTIGANYTHFRKAGYSNVVVSRNHLNNRAFKYLGNDYSSEANKILDYRSQEIENKLRIEDNIRNNGWRINYGVNYEYATYLNSTFNVITLPSGENFSVNSNSELNFNKYGAFGQVSKGFVSNLLTLSFGFRVDGMDYNSVTSNPIDQFSPRFSASYMLSERLSLNANVGRYYQAPAYTVLGYRDNTGRLVNRDNKVGYITSDHAVAGIEYNNGTNAKFSVEGFYKIYDNYPFLLRDSISLANLGGDFGVIGNEPAVSTSEGRSYGMEFLAQQKLYKGFYGIVAYTLVRSEFKDRNGDYAPSAWDNQHIVSLTGGKKFKRNWELGAKWRFSAGTPYTPIDIALSSHKEVWDLNGFGLLDYSQLNSERLPVVHQLDLRIDKKYFFKKWSLNLYFDIQNAYGFTAQLPKNLDVVRDSNGMPVEDPNDPTRYQTKLIDNTTGTTIPSLGVIVDW